LYGKGILGKHAIPMAFYIPILHERLLHEHSNLEHLELVKSRETAFRLLPYNHSMQQAPLAMYPTAARKEIAIFVNINDIIQQGRDRERIVISHEMPTRYYWNIS